MGKIANTKIRQFDVDFSGLGTVEESQETHQLVNHFRTLIQEMINCRRESGVDEEIDYSKKIIDNKLVCEDENALEYEKQLNQGIDGITASKRDDAISIYIDLIIGQIDKLFKISATPIPDLPKREEDEVVKAIEEVINIEIQNNFEEAKLGYMEELTRAGILVTEQQAQQEILKSRIDLVPTEEEIRNMASRFKRRATAFMNKQATVGAKRMERNIHDILVETDFGGELLKFIHDFASYPYAVMRKGLQGPIARKVWKGDKWTFEDQILPVDRRVAPQHFYWSSDSLDVNDGVAVGDVVYYKRSDLERLYQFEDDKVIKDNIQECVTMCNSFTSWRNWLDGLGHDNENCDDDKSGWSPSATVPVFRLHTLLDSCHLKEYGIKVKGKDKLHQYECEVWLLNQKIVRFKLFDPKGYKRPYTIEKFRHLPGRFSGKSLPDVLRPVEHQIRSVKRNEILNIGFSSAPVTLIDETAFDTDDDALRKVVQPGDVYNVKSYPGKNMKPIEFVTMTNITNQLRAVLNDLYAEADIKSQIPRILTGQGNLGSSIRSASMLATQVSSASKNLKRQIWLIAQNIIKPYIECVFDWYMENGEDELAKIDADVNIGSIESLVNREFLLNQIRGLIQYLAPYVSGGMIDPSVIQNLLNTLLVESGISEDTNNSEILDELQGIANDVTSNVGLRPASGQVQLDGRSDFQSVDTGSLTS